MTLAPRIAICGPGRCGKDVASLAFASSLGVEYRKSTSQAAQALVWEQWGHAHYTDADAMFQDRSNHRMTWADIIYKHNAPDGITLYRDMLEGGEVIFCGIRRLAELRACQQAGIVQYAVWIDRPGCTDTTCEITAGDCDFRIPNAGSEEQFKLMCRATAKIVRHLWLGTPPAEIPDFRDLLETEIAEFMKSESTAELGAVSPSGVVVGWLGRDCRRGSRT